MIPDEAVEAAEAAAKHDLDPAALDWHVEAVHGWEPHNDGYEDAIRQAAECLANGGCE